MLDPSKLQEMMQQAQQMQQQMLDQLAKKSVEGAAGGGMVKVVMNGTMQVDKVTIDPVVVDKDDVGMLEDLVRAAVNDAATKVEELRMEQARGLAGNMGIPPGMI